MDVVSLIGVILGSSGAATLITNWFKDRKHKRELAADIKEKNRFLSGLKRISSAYDLLGTLEHIPIIDRVLLIKVTNGGATPRLGSTIYASAIKATAETQAESRKIEEIYAKVRVDDAYIKMCIRAAQGEVYEFDVAKHEECILKDFYMSEDVKYAEIYHLYTDIDEDAMYIISLATKKEENILGFKRQVNRARILISLEALRRIFETNDQ